MFTINQHRYLTSGSTVSVPVTVDQISSNENYSSLLSNVFSVTLSGANTIIDIGIAFTGNNPSRINIAGNPYTIVSIPAGVQGTVTSGGTRFIEVDAGGSIRVKNKKKYVVKANTRYRLKIKTTYTINYNANGGSGSMAPTHGTTIAACTFTAPVSPPGQVFINWNTAADGSGTRYTALQVLPSGMNLALYAMWGVQY